MRGGVTCSTVYNLKKLAGKKGNILLNHCELATIKGHELCISAGFERIFLIIFFSADFSIDFRLSGFNEKKDTKRFATYTCVIASMPPFKKILVCLLFLMKY